VIEFIIGLLETLVLEWFGGNSLLALFDEYFLNQSSLNQVLLLTGAFSLMTLGVVSLIKYILKKTKGIVSIVLIGGVAYYIIVVVLDVDVFSIFG
jgi:hypothetical protein